MVILDVLTPLIDPRLDVEGNAAHWMLRTADAALPATQGNWLAAFDSQDLWNAMDAGPALTAWTPFLNPIFRSRKGRSAPLVHARMGRHFSLAWEKAVRNWNYAFRDNAEHFTDKLLESQGNFSAVTQRWLGLVGLRAGGFLGAFSMHLMALCGNEELFDIPQGWTIFSTLFFPAPPIIPPAFRVALDHGLMGILGRDVYALLQDDTAVVPNDKLDLVLGGALGLDYAGPPASYMHVERHGGTWVLHTHIEGTPTHQAPQALDFHVPMPSFTETGIRVPVQTDLYGQLISGDLPVPSGFLRLDTIVGDHAEADLLLLRSDLPGAPTVLSAHPGTVFALPALPEGVTWQLVALSGTLPQPIPQVTYLGRLWFVDSGGNESNHASWSVSGNILTTHNFNVVHTFPHNSAGFLLIDEDLFRHAIPGAFPLATMHFQWVNRFPWAFPINLNFHISTDPGQGTTLESPGDTVYHLDALLPGVTWDMRVLAFGALQSIIPLVLTGRFWVTDTLGEESQHATWRVFIFSST